ncbi:unnamed protein product, partial [Ectocarpus sp. 12 AP-2014]
ICVTHDDATRTRARAEERAARVVRDCGVLSIRVLALCATLRGQPTVLELLCYQAGYMHPVPPTIQAPSSRGRVVMVEILSHANYEYPPPAIKHSAFTTVIVERRALPSDCP